ncbi:MAG: hypothetical protein QNL21_04325 [Flavobacteriales bacterium]|jgi:hypothetical protein
MKPIQRLILILAVVWIAVKLLLFYSGNSLTYAQLAVSLNIGFTLYIIYKALKNHYSNITQRTIESPLDSNLFNQSSEDRPANHLPQNGTDFLIDFKVSMKSAVQYSLIIFGFLAIYYMVIDPEYIAGIVNERIELLSEQIIEAGGYDAVMEANKGQINIPQGKGLPSEEEYLKEIRVNFMTMLNMKVFLSLIFTYFFLLNLTCSAVISGIAGRIFVKHT